MFDTYIGFLQTLLKNCLVSSSSGDVKKEVPDRNGLQVQILLLHKIGM